MTSDSAVKYEAEKDLQVINRRCTCKRVMPEWKQLTIDSAVKYEAEQDLHTEGVPVTPEWKQLTSDSAVKYEAE